MYVPRKRNGQVNAWESRITEWIISTYLDEYIRIQSFCCAKIIWAVMHFFQLYKVDTSIQRILNDRSHIYIWISYHSCRIDESESFSRLQLVSSDAWMLLKLIKTCLETILHYCSELEKIRVNSSLWDLDLLHSISSPSSILLSSALSNSKYGFINQFQV